MAENEKWCQSLKTWKGYFKEWIESAKPEQVLSFSIFFDLRPVFGDAHLAQELRSYINTVLKNAPWFFSQLAKNCLQYKPPIRILGTLVTTGNKEHPGGLDLKAPTMAIVSFARLYALHQNSNETNTQARLDGLTRSGVLLESKYRSMITAYEALLRLRLWNQSTAISQNKEPHNFVDPEKLGNIEEVILKECYREVGELGFRIVKDFFGGVSY
jgi:CBS domain-containing protein